MKVTAAAINPSDVRNVLGKMQTVLPRIPGRDLAGRVVSGDSQWHGKRVFGTGGDLGFGRDGSHTEFVAVPVRALVEIPPEFNEENAASVGVIYLTAFGFKAGIFFVPTVERGSLDGAVGAYRAIDEGSSKNTFVIRFG